MDGPEFYFSTIVREKVSELPSLQDGETQIEQYERGVQPMAWILVIICLFFFPLLPFALAFLAYDKFWHLKHSKITLTDKRLIYANRAFKTYHVASIPLNKIKSIRRSSLDNPFVGMIDRLFGLSDVQIWTDESILRQFIMDGVKKSKNLVSAIENIENRKIGKI